MACQVFDTAGLIGKKWTTTLLDEVQNSGEEGFNHLLRRMKKVSSKVLAQRLDDLEEAGLVKKSVLAEKPVKKTAYHLTAKGRELQGILMQLKKWNIKHASKKLPCLKIDCVDCPLY